MPTAGRGALPFALIHGESLVAAATWGLEAVEVIPIGHGTTTAALRERGECLVLHDPLCPMTPPEFIAECVQEAIADDLIIVAVRPVTDTIKVMEGEFVGRTLDRDQLLSLASPIVFGPGRLSELPDLDLDGVLFVDLVATLSEVNLKPAPALAARVHDDVELQMLEAASLVVPPS
ncbi:MAG: 2-C-methyl-D-erythritol 4-phosphate cytidylyltransferase [Nocardioidaceae bacterium]